MYYSFKDVLLLVRRSHAWSVVVVDLIMNEKQLVCKEYNSFYSYVVTNFLAKVLRFKKSQNSGTVHILRHHQGGGGKIPNPSILV